MPSPDPEAAPMDVPRPFSLLVVDPSPGFREAVRMLVTAEAPECELVGEISDGEGAGEAARRLRPDVVLLERVLPDRSGLEVLRELCRAWPDGRVLITSVDWDAPSVEAAVDAGATGVLSKHAAADRLARALRSVAAGKTVRPPELEDDGPDGG